ncbi:MAG: UvrD-helicase domain-containing protein [Bacteroidota bacterium]
MSPLHVYKASAGSGKTYALTLEYLKLLFRIPEAHRHILAVTFTNKAAGEMKSRILRRLFDLSRGDPDAGSEDLKVLVEATGMDAARITERAGNLLNLILNDYTWFSVGTIDRFFQSVIRAFTREIGIQPGYNLELDHQRILSMGVDLLFQEIGDDAELQQWLIRFAEERMEESRSWNFKNDILALGMELFRESFQELYADTDLSLLNKKNLEDFLKELGQIEAQTTSEMKQMGARALDQIRLKGFEVEDFKLKGNSPPALFRQAAEGEVHFSASKLDALADSGKWLVKGASAEMAMLTEEFLMPLLNQVYRGQVVLNTIRTIRVNYYTLGILGDIREKVQAYLKEHNLFLITDSSRFLRGILGANQVPFIYEKTGNRYKHIMLDEFQDTSVFQYENFRPLIDNSLASGNDNLVVGDVKQSIYRWRNSDWRILAGGLKSDFSHQEYKVHKLDQNYRSSEQVIRFNNTVFQLASKELAREIEEELGSSPVNKSEAEEAVLQFRNAYADAVQQIPSRALGSDGFVKVSFFREEQDLSFRDQVLESIPGWINEIQQSGIEPGEIAILVRTRREGVLVAEKLMGHFRIISNESLLMAHNGSVSMVVSALRYMVFPGDEINNALLKYRCYQAGIAESVGPDNLFNVDVSPGQILPAAFVSRMSEFRQLPLYELVEALIHLFGLDTRTNDLPYIQALQDLVIDIQRREPVGIAEFLQYWEQHGSKKGIQISENSNAIRILTIHRSKGLEFKAVMIPFFNWEITTDQRKSNILWCPTIGTPFSRIPIVPVRFGSGMKHTLFSAFYYQERMKGYLDSLNLMYVAFTRAVDVLYLGVPVSEDQGLKTTGDLLPAILDHTPENQPALLPLSSYMKNDKITIGRMPEQLKIQEQKDPWQFVAYKTNPGSRLPGLRLRSDQYFVDEQGLFRTGRGFGNMMHMVFSGIQLVEDVVPLLNKLQKEGVLSARDRPGLEKEILEMISQPGVSRWFSGEEGRSILNERSILCGDGNIVRPDRVIVDRDGVTVVDFKFGMLEKETHRDQVRNYMELLKGMRYKQVAGFIWYAMLGRIEKIDVQ